MSEETKQGKAKLIPGDLVVNACALCGTEFEEPLPSNIFNQCDPEEGCGKYSRVVEQ